MGGFKSNIDLLNKYICIFKNSVKKAQKVGKTMPVHFKKHFDDFSCPPKNFSLISLWKMTTSPPSGTCITQKTSARKTLTRTPTYRIIPTAPSAPLGASSVPSSSSLTWPLPYRTGHIPQSSEALPFQTTGQLPADVLLTSGAIGRH